jgi:hypothetical protein
MGRPIAPELISAYLYAAEFYRSQNREIQRLSYPKRSSHMKFGPSSTAPTPDDPKIEKVGLYLVRIMPHERRLMDLEFDYDLTPYVRAKKMGVNERRYNKDRRDILIGLKSFLMAF